MCTSWNRRSGSEGSGQPKTACSNPKRPVGMSSLAHGVPVSWHFRRRRAPGRARWLSRCAWRRPPCRHGSTCRQTPVAHDGLTLDTLGARRAWRMTQRCLEWIALAMVSSGLTLCPSTAPAAHDLRAVLALRVNLRDQGEIRVLLREGDVLARMADLKQAGLQGVAGQREVVAGESYVSLASLDPDITYVLDEQTVTLHLTVAPALLPPTVLNLSSDRTPGITYSPDSSAFL